MSAPFSDGDVVSGPSINTCYNLREREITWVGIQSTTSGTGALSGLGQSISGNNIQFMGAVGSFHCKRANSGRWGGGLDATRDDGNIAFVTGSYHSDGDSTADVWHIFRLANQEPITYEATTSTPNSSLGSAFNFNVRATTSVNGQAMIVSSGAVIVYYLSKETT